MLHEGVMFLCRALRERLEPVGVVGRSELHSPPFHARRHLVGDAAIECRAVVYHVHELGEHVAREIFEHLLAVEHVFSEILTRSFLRYWKFPGFCLKSLFNYSES